MWGDVRRNGGGCFGNMLVELVVDGHKHAAKIHFGANARRGLDGGAAEEIAVVREHAELAGTRIKSGDTIAPALVFLSFLSAKKS